MAERCAKPRGVHLQYAHDRLLAAKLEQAYAILVADRVRVVGGRGKLTGEDEDDEGRRDLCSGLFRKAEGVEHDCQPDSGTRRVRPRPGLQRAR